MAHWNGTSGDVNYGTTALNVTEWSATDKTIPLDVTDKGDGGYQYIIGGIKSCDCEVKANWDSAINEGNPPRITSGSTVTLTLYLYDGGPALTGQFFIEEMAYSSPTTGTVGYSFKAKSVGQFSLPGANNS